MKITIYLITCLANGKVYVGQTINTLKRRFSQHKSDAKRSPDTKIGRAINRYGANQFTIEPIVYCENQSLADNLEDEYITKYDSISTGYNINRGGKAYIFVTPETRKKISAAKKGVPHSEEAKKNMSLAHMGSKNHFYGKHHSNEAKELIAKARTGTTISPEIRKRMSDAQSGEKHHLFGKPCSEERKQNISKANKKNAEMYSKLITGEKNPGAKLTEEQVIEIKHLLIGGKTPKEIALIYNVIPGTISNIRSGKRWKHIIVEGNINPISNQTGKGYSVLKEELVKEIKQLLRDGKRVIDIARQYNVGETTIYCIKNGKTWKDVE